VEIFRRKKGKERKKMEMKGKKGNIVTFQVQFRRIETKMFSFD